MTELMELITQDVAKGNTAASPAQQESGSRDSFLSFFGLKTNPFPDAISPEFYYKTDSHDGAYLRMMAAIEQDFSLALVTGGSGTGKTLLSQLLLKGLDPAKYQTALVLVTPNMGKTALLQEMLTELDIPVPEGTCFTRDMLKLLSQRIVELHYQGKRPVVLIDECHFLSAESLHTLRTLSNIETPEHKLLTCVLFAEPRFLRRLDNPSYDSLRGRIYLRVELLPLSVQDCAQYIKFRLLVAGGSGEIFDATALSALHYCSGGTCRNINKLCYLSLLQGYIEKKPAIDSTIVALAARDTLRTENANAAGERPAAT